MYKYHLQTDPFTIWDRLKICKFLLNKKNRLTMGEKVAQLEEKMSHKYGSLCLAVSSGSAANHLIFELWKQKNPKKFKNSLVIAPSTTWMSSVSPAIMAGYKLQFCDINLNDFSFDYEMLENILKKNKDKNCIIWPTALIGFCPDFDRLKYLSEKYKTELWGDFCENLHSTYKAESIFKVVKMSSLSGYMAHQITGLEIGWVFFKNIEDYEFGKTLRNHGLVRSLGNENEWRKSLEKEYSYIDPQFLFATLGTNWRTTDINAYFALLDFERIDFNKIHSKKIFNKYNDLLDKGLYYLPPDLWDYNHSTLKRFEHVPFCLPIIPKRINTTQLLKNILNKAGWETRPIISYLSLNKPFKKYQSPKFKNSLWLHDHGFYVGLSNSLKENDIKKLTDILNNYDSQLD